MTHLSELDKWSLRVSQKDHSPGSPGDQASYTSETLDHRPDQESLEHWGSLLHKASMEGLEHEN